MNSYRVKDTEVAEEVPSVKEFEEVHHQAAPCVVCRSPAQCNLLCCRIGKKETLSCVRR